MTVTAAQYAQALRDEGATVRLMDGWETRTVGGTFAPIGSLFHHTGPYSTIDGIERLLRDGRSDLRGPLCRGSVRPDGAATLIAWGKANHAGPGDADVLAAIMRGELPPLPRADSVSGNPHLTGWECIHSGDPATPLPAAQVDGMHRIAAAECRLYGWSPNAIGFHKTWTLRKRDPVGLDIAEFRAAVAARLATPPAPYVPPAAAPKKGLDMPTIVRDEHGKLLLSDLATWHKPISEDALRVLLADKGHVDQTERSDALYAYALSLPKWTAGG